MSYGNKIPALFFLMQYLNSINEANPNSVQIAKLKISLRGHHFNTIVRV